MISGSLLNQMVSFAKYLTSRQGNQGAHLILERGAAQVLPARMLRPLQARRWIARLIRSRSRSDRGVVLDFAGVSEPEQAAGAVLGK